MLQAVKNGIEKIKKQRFLFEELVKRDFKKKYKRTVLGMGWSMLSPLLMLLVMKLILSLPEHFKMEHHIPLRGQPHLLLLQGLHLRRHERPHAECGHHHQD